MEDGRIMEMIVYLCGVIVAIGGATAVVIKLSAPYKSIKNRLDKHDQLFANDNERLKRIEDMTQQSCSSLVTLLDHAATGNSVDKCRESRDTLMKFLATRR